MLHRFTNILFVSMLMLGISTQLSAQRLNTMSIAPDGTVFVAGSDGYIAKITDGKDKYSSRFYYDEIGRLVLSQNAKQYAKDKKEYSYTLYDALGRPYEAGQVIAPEQIQTASSSEG
ncbi:MAG: hypothetical protein JXQ69_01000, partial [Paludibacteraceae bacterium]|nr:hypothetical protein [Paludibacteraceae bacterium]